MQTSLYYVFIEFKATPPERANDVFFGTGNKPVLVGIFNPEDKPAIVFPGK
jgi:hypothetical protein